MHSFESPAGASLRVDFPAGTLTVETWTEPRVEIEVAAARGGDRSAEAAAATRVSASGRDERPDIVVRAPKRDGWRSLGRGAELAVSIRCPEGSDVELATQSADLEGRGRLGAVTARSASGDATLDDVGSLSFTTASGDLTARDVGGALAAKSASGDVDVRSIGATGSVTTVSGDIRIGAASGEVALKSVSGDVEIGAAGARVLVATVSGDVEVGAVPGLVLWIDAQSVSGSMSCELDMGEETAASRDDAVELRVRSVSGDVRITRSMAAAH